VSALVLFEVLLFCCFVLFVFTACVAVLVASLLGCVIAVLLLFVVVILLCCCCFFC